MASAIQAWRTKVGGMHRASFLGFLWTVIVKKMCCDSLYLRPFLAGVPQGREVRNTKQSWSGAFPVNFAPGNFTFTSLGSSQFKSQLGKHWNVHVSIQETIWDRIKTEFWEMNVFSLYPLLLRLKFPSAVFSRKQSICFLWINIFSRTCQSLWVKRQSSRI